MSTSLERTKTSTRKQVVGKVSTKVLGRIQGEANRWLSTKDRVSTKQERVDVPVKD